jgi:hypothetical protein
MVAMGCWAKFKFGGGFAVGRNDLRGTEDVCEKDNILSTDCSRKP